MHDRFTLLSLNPERVDDAVAYLEATRGPAADLQIHMARW
ncbi:MAG: hypothetical protein JWN47_2977 [Frankiales bacterium]|nr:hypothetical protein [Frankiales bacterium]